MTPEEIHAIPAVDVHSHFGPYNVKPGEEYYPAAIETPGEDVLLRRLAQANVAVSINSHMYGLMPRGKGDPFTANVMLTEAVERLPGVYGWVIVDPTKPETFAQARELLSHPKVIGIKVHPEEHLYPIREYGEKIYEFAAKEGCIIVTHSGEQNSMPEDFCFFANRYPTVKTIISHLGCGFDGCYEHQLRAIEENTQDNLFTDTSSAKSLMAGIIEYAVGRIGSEKILFGSDHTCYFLPSQRARIDCADISDEDKKNILYRNAVRIFPALKAVYEKETARR